MTLPCALVLPCVFLSTLGKNHVCRVPVNLPTANYGAHGKIEVSSSDGNWPIISLNMDRTKRSSIQFNTSHIVGWSFQISLPFLLYLYKHWPIGEGLGGERALMVATLQWPFHSGKREASQPLFHFRSHLCSSGHSWNGNSSSRSNTTTNSHSKGKRLYFSPPCCIHVEEH